MLWHDDFAQNVRSKIPNILSGIRLVFFWVPGLVIWLWRDDTTLQWWAFGVFVFLAFLDILDGKLARRWNQITELGKVLDPLADKFLVAGTLLALCIHQPLLWLPTAVILVRELVVTLRLRTRGRVVAAVGSGKLKMVMQVVMILALIAPIGGLWWIAQLVFVLIAVGLTIYSWIDYIRKFG